MHRTITCFRPSSGMRCDGRLLSSFITGALTATTVTLFLLRVVPGTYVVLPCDPTITLRPVSMEEYMDHIDKQQEQEVFPADEAIDTRPIHIPDIVEAPGSKRKKSSHPQKHRNQLKRNSQKQNHKKQEHMLDSKQSTVTSDTLSGKPKDLTDQLKELQNKEEKEKRLQENLQLRPSTEQKQHLKRKLQQEQRQVKQHIKEIQLHIQQQAKEMKQKQDENDKKIREQKLKERQQQAQQNKKQILSPKKKIDERLQSSKELSSSLRDNEIIIRTKRELDMKKNNEIKIKKKENLYTGLPDSKLLHAIGSLQDKQYSSNLKTNGYIPSPTQRLEDNKSQIVIPHEIRLDTRVSHKVTDISVPKLSRIVPWNAKTKPPLA